MSMDINSITAMMNQTGATNATNSAAAFKAQGLSSKAQGLSSESTEEELKEVLKDFESYFLEQMIKKMKDTFTDEDEEQSMAGQYTDTFMDYAIEDIADILLDEVGGSMTQQLFEQMKRNYNIPTVEEKENVAAQDAASTTTVDNVE